MNCARLLALFLAGAVLLCLIALRVTRSQSNSLRRITNTSEEALNLNPSVSGDGCIVAFESTEDLAAAGGVDHFRAVVANVAVDPIAFSQIADTRAVAPAISQDGSRIAFASNDDPLGTNQDGNSEIFLFDGLRLTQITDTKPISLGDRTKEGNFQPSISDDGRFIAFSSNRDLTGQNGDGNLEILVFDSLSVTFNQLTLSTGIVGFSDAKISGNGNFVAYVGDNGNSPGATRNLIEQPRSGGPATLLASGVAALAITYGRAISDDGTRVVYSAQTATNTTQVFLYDGRTTGSGRQITSLGARVNEVPLQPSISGDGTRISFATRRNVNAGNSDGSVELYVYDLPTATFSEITNAPAGATGEVVSSLNDDGSIVVFNFPRVLSGPVNDSDLANDSEIYIAEVPARPGFASLTVLNGASLGHEPSAVKAVAPDSIAVARGGLLANATRQPQRLPDGTFPTNVGGTKVSVNGRLAQIFFVSPNQVNFLVPSQTEIGVAEVVVTNPEGFSSRGNITVWQSAPGVFTRSGDGIGEALTLNSDSLQEAPFDPSEGHLRLTIFATGARNAARLSVAIGGQLVEPEFVLASADMPGLDEIHIKVPPTLKGSGVVTVTAQGDGRDANPVSTRFAGGEILINEVLADPPGATPADLIGDANQDGVRSSTDDEFVELVNSTSDDIDISGNRLLTRSSTAANDTLRHTFAAGTILAARTAVVVFGGGAPNPADPVFGGALVLKASSGALSLSNTGGIVTLQDSVGGVVNIFEYGGATGLSGGSNQSLTRSPDITGGFTGHLSATGANGRPFSPGTRVDTTPFLTIPISRIDLSPFSPVVDEGATQQFTARAFDADNRELAGPIFVWQSSNTSVATIDQAGLATSLIAGSSQITAMARGVQSMAATLTVRSVQRVLTRIDVTPNPATIPAFGAQQFIAKGLDQFGHEIPDLTFAWDSNATDVATIDKNGLAAGLAPGQSTIRATTQGVTGLATLNVTQPTLVVNEVLADPPAGNDGDANHDGVRDGVQDEFIELVNSTGFAINISGWTVRTRSSSSANETVRHTFATNVNVAAGEAMVIFGGGNFDPANALFGCAQVVKSSSGSLALTNSGLTILVRDEKGNLVTQMSYGGVSGLNGGNGQSLTRSPDVTGNFVLHTSVAAAHARKFSAGLKLDGTPFSSCPGHPAAVTLSPASITTNVNQATTFTAQAFDQFGRAMIGVPITFTSDNTTVATVDSIMPNPLTGVFTASVLAHNPGIARISASAADGTMTASSDQAVLTVTGPQLMINDVSADEGSSGTTTLTFTVSTNSPAPASGLSFDIETADGTAKAESGDYVARSRIRQTIPAGQSSYLFEVEVNGDTLVEPNEIFFANLSNAAGGTIGDSQGVGTIQNDDVANLVISQLFAGGGLTNATFGNDFIELFNRGTTTVDFAVTPYSAQFLSTSGSTWSKTDLSSGSIAPGRYFLIREGSGGSSGAALPASDAAGTINLTSTTAGKVALVSNATLLTGNCPGDDGAAPFNPLNANVADFLGYGGTVTTSNHCYEGSGPAVFTLSNNTIATYRRAGGCTDTNDNSPNFFISTPAPRNSSSAANNCAGAPPNLSINDVTLTEGNSGTTTATFTVTLSAPAEGADVTFDISTADATAMAANGDYVAKALTNQIIPAGHTTYSFSVSINGDTTVEGDEMFLVNISNASGATVIGGQAQATIRNDDFPTLSVTDVSAYEGDSGTKIFAFSVNLSAPAPAPVTFEIATQDGTATVADDDYVSNSLTAQTIPAGQQTYQFEVTIKGDLNIEPGETFSVNVSNAAGAIVIDGQGQGTIQNDDSPVLNIDDVSLAEGDSATITFTFTVTSTRPAPPGGIAFDINTSDGTAQHNNPNGEYNDYIANSSTSKMIVAGSSSTTFDVRVIGDMLVEPNETFIVRISNASGGGATIADGEALGIIQNDDVANLVISQVYGGGSNSGASYQNDFVEIFNPGTTTVDFTVTPYSVQYASVGANFGSSKTNLTNGVMVPGSYFLVRESGGTANGVPLPAPDATGTIAMAATSGKVALVVGNGALPSLACPGDDGTPPLNPSNGTIVDFIGYGGNANASGHCYEGDGPSTAPGNTTAVVRKGGGCFDTTDNAADFFAHSPVPRNSSTELNACGGQMTDIVVSDVTVTEGDTGTGAANFTISLITASSSTVTVDYATSNGSATAPEDYTAQPATQLIFNPGETSKIATVMVNGDTLDEPDETFFINLSNAVNAAILDNQGQGTIIDNDVPPTLTINDVAQNEGNSGVHDFVFTVHLSAPALIGGVTFDIATADGTAQDHDPVTEDDDYVPQKLTSVTIPAGHQDYSFNVAVNGDLKIEPNETFLVEVTNVTGATVSDGQAVGVIQNDDSPSLSISDVTQTEGDTGTTTFEFVVTSSLPAPPGGITFDIATADGTAQDDNPSSEDNDYVPQSLTGQTIPAGETTYTFIVAVIGDTKNEAVCETFLVNLSNTANATISDGQAQGSIIDSDGTKLVITQIYGGGGNSAATYTNDFIEIFNRGDVPISLNGLSVQYAAATSTTGSYSVTALPNVNLLPGHYFLIQEASAGAVGSPLPAPDATGTINLAASAGKVALVNGNAALSAAGCPSGAAILDFVGYGTTANCREGSSTAENAPGPSNNTTSVQRKLNGCQDSGVNGPATTGDFITGAVSPRNTASAANTCNCGTSYSSLLILGGDSWRSLLARLWAQTTDDHGSNWHFGQRSRERSQFIQFPCG